MVISLLPPVDECNMPFYFFSVLQPVHHLRVLVLVIGRAVGIFRHVNVQAFGLFHVVIVRHPEQPD